MISLVPSDYQDIRFVNDDDFAFTDFLIENFEAGPFESLKIVECVLVKFREVKQLLGDGRPVRARASCTLRLVHGAKVLDLLLGHLELACEVLHAVVLFLILAADDAHELAVRTSEDYGWTLVLVREQFLVRHDLLAALIGMNASELYLAKQIARHPVDPIELTLVAAVRACVRVLHEPVSLAITAEWLLTVFALDWVLQDVVADAANELRQEGLHVLRVVDLVLLVDELLVHFRLVDDVLHCRLISIQLLTIRSYICEYMMEVVSLFCSNKYYLYFQFKVYLLYCLNLCFH